MRTGAAALALAGLLIAPACAPAATRYVTPDGAGTGACGPAAPCSIAWAVNGEGSEAGDEILLARGTYADQPLVVTRPLTITAAPDQPRPVITATAPGAVAVTLAAEAGDTVLEHVVVRATGEGTAGVDAGSSATLSDLAIGAATGPCLRSGAMGLRLTDVALTQTGQTTGTCLETTGDDTAWEHVTVAAPHARLAAAYSGDGTITDVTVHGGRDGLQLGGTAGAHRVTAIANRYGLVLTGTTLVTDSVAVARRPGGAAAVATTGTHELLNLTAWAAASGATAVRAQDGADLTVKNTIARGAGFDLEAQPGGRLSVDHSNWRTGPGAVDLGANQSAPPNLVSPSRGDFRLRRGSPAIDAGSFEVNGGSADRAGRFRWLGAAPDLGAYERPAPRPPARRLDRRRPRFGVVRLTDYVFRVAPRGVAFAAARRPPAGTRLIYVVSEDSDLVLLVRHSGQRRLLGTIVQPAHRGANRLALSGRLDGRPLAPGRYELTIMARDVAQNLGTPRRLVFRVVR